MQIVGENVQAVRPQRGTCVANRARCGGQAGHDARLRGVAQRGVWHLRQHAARSEVRVSVNIGNGVDPGGGYLTLAQHRFQVCRIKTP